ncbi:MAG: radical SAM protein [Methanobacteriota archaeon]|nr:MAG: radical SAM protein [Euryarchaeota archaeon]
MKICEIYSSIQGEGLDIGAPTVFVRTSGCPLKCKWCDTLFAFTEGDEMTVEEILEKVQSFSVSRVCLTGGEPLIQKDMYGLINKLLDSNYFVSIETGGSIAIEDMPCVENLRIVLDIKCPSSEMQDKMEFSNIELLGPTDELKFVVADREDYDYAKGIIAKYEPICSIVMQPVWGNDIKELAEWVINDKLNARVLPQLHKIIWGEERGV